MAELTEIKQEMFCRHYITEIDGERFHGTKSAIKAGYSPKTAHVQASRLLSYAKVQDRLAELQQAAFKRCEIDADYVLNGFKKIADDDIRNYLSFGMKDVVVGIDNENKPIIVEKIGVDLMDSDDIDTWNISEVSIGKDGQFKFKTHCKDNALLQLGKHLALFTDKVDISIKEIPKIVLKRGE